MVRSLPMKRGRKAWRVRVRLRTTIVMLLGWLAACGSASVTTISPTPLSVTDVARAAVSASDRTDDDRKEDGWRHPAEMLSFFETDLARKRGATIAAAGGYTTELLARGVGPTGRVFGQNSKWLIENFAERPFSRRLARPAMHNVVRVDREFEDPFPPDAQNLDAVVCVMFYHDLFWLNVDRDKMNRAVYRALRPGGIYAIIDHSGRPGTGATEVKTLHRIDEMVVRTEIERAGFRLRSEGAFLRNPRDTRDWNASPDEEVAPQRGTTDRFTLAYEKP